MAEDEFSELNQTCRDAILAIKSASDIIGSLFDGMHTYAEDISDQMITERNMYQVEDFHERFVIQGEIEAALSFFGKLLPAYLIILVALLEDRLHEISLTAAQVRNVEPPHERSKQFTIEQAMEFFRNHLEIQFPNPWPTWEKVQDIQNLRNKVVNSAGLNAEANAISYESLDDFCETIIQFLDELRTQLVDQLESEA